MRLFLCSRKERLDQLRLACSILDRQPSTGISNRVLGGYKLKASPSSLNTGTESRYCKAFRSRSNGHSTCFHVMNSLTCLASSQNFWKRVKECQGQLSSAMGFARHNPILNACSFWIISSSSFNKHCIWELGKVRFSHILPSNSAGGGVGGEGGDRRRGGRHSLPLGAVSSLWRVGQWSNLSRAAECAQRWSILLPLPPEVFPCLIQTLIIVTRFNTLTSKLTWPFGRRLTQPSLRK